MTPRREGEGTPSPLREREPSSFVPLREGEGATAALLRAAATPLPDEPVARGRVRARLFSAAPLSPWRLVLVGAGATFAGVALALVLLGPPAARPLLAHEQLDGVEFRLAPEAVGSLKAGKSIALSQGVMDVIATRPVAVHTPQVVVFAERASFRVSVLPSGDVAVVVYEGSAEVRGPNGKATVTPDHAWALGTQVDSAQLLHREALRLERDGKSGPALQVLEGLLDHPGAWGELALYDAARLELDRGERARAQALVELHDRRFPAGTLQVEVAALKARLSGLQK